MFQTVFRPFVMAPFHKRYSLHLLGAPSAPPDRGSLPSQNSIAQRHGELIARSVGMERWHGEVAGDLPTVVAINLLPSGLRNKVI